ncbi:MAG TPA: LytTR family DNA-binding domain-containing protein [Kofleriaceae bacterium]|nr:LytTR family DNA-binding domain-containing protein [Kofleriaceae bacterium]
MKTLIVDDERLARRRLQRLLLHEPDVELVGQARNAREARTLVAHAAPALMFVDIQMPRVGAFELLAGLAPHVPTVIFVTAYEQYAVQAFEVKACDYLLKPVDPARLRLAVQRARDALGRAEPVADAAPVGDAAPPAAPQDVRMGAVLVRTRTKVLRIELADIDWIEAAGNYVHLHVDRQVYLLRETITAFEDKLAPAQFARIHRTAIVNLDRVVEFHPTPSGDFSVRLRGGAQLRMSRTYRGRIRDVFGNAI